MKDLLKKCSMLVLCLTILFVSLPGKVMAAGEPADGYYRIKNVATGEYLCSEGGVVFFSSNSLFYSDWIVQNTTGSTKWFSIRPTYNNQLAISFSDKDARVSLESYIPGNVGRYDEQYTAFTKQRFSFGLIPSGYNIKPIAFSDATDNRVLDRVDNYWTVNLQLKKASGARSQIFVLEYQGPLK